MLILKHKALQHDFVLTLTHPSDARLRTARTTWCDGLWPVWLPKAAAQVWKNIHTTCSHKTIASTGMMKLPHSTSSEAAIQAGGRRHLVFVKDKIPIWRGRLQAAT
jgi:hypothetical protein